MQPVRRQTLIAQVTEQLRAEIAGGRWPVGSRIPTETELRELTGTARNTVREAVQALVHAGMLERRQGSGTYVLSACASSALGDYFSAARDTDLLELREALDVTAAGLAALRRDEDDIIELRRLLARRNELWSPERVAAGSEEEAVRADLAMHRGIVAASHNTVYLEFYDSLVPVLQEQLEEFPVGAATSYESGHITLVEAVIAGDAQGARDAAQHLLNEVRLRRR
ncbi:GntR domain protein OS=Tsukamurella paurometabola (strain ATCC 8368 / DSM / CCUG 35730 / CIP 100753 / JCM 10117 / KCTC 9821 / NBRC 16120 / NCIMB 702349/ NCTC 13040) OX=521096 GN=Tpau_2216 PE=4 SV=1 [Tsukamurella paurometabola]|uniref:GntR domain protein n=1 Tax=Tsukamurella paurometabola (strain ATCC 8368 / DSM 20162 / CCUG 35730 / CIP 100753 / JCM 10117 / KCTC 9821 / NBRC 16120 / NCIMB 702349 / NCTC 13040) TaxID=521096 RepID=D5UQ55_TSUPD|nr:FadR/GntR family transcriptional regulator [Tsukamurella paurometabola]ADG78825.1 GntR domain protein [Tsukamurella paurometabola DSM 20162]SUP33253.1 Pyruvate dehydrogenase complex repressor [Tsukamurella paurometabola]